MVGPWILTLLWAAQVLPLHTLVLFLADLHLGFGLQELILRGLIFNGLEDAADSVEQ